MKTNQVRNSEIEMRISPRVRWLVKNVSGARILDVGFLGSYSKPLVNILVRESNKNSLIVGVDTNKEAVYKHSLPNSVLGDGFNLPFKDSTFDSIILAEVIEHEWHSLELIKEAHRVVKAKGRLYLTTPNPLALHRIWKFWLASRKPCDPANYRRYLGDPGHKLFYDPLSLCNLLATLGFSVLEITTKNFSFHVLRKSILAFKLEDLKCRLFNRLGGYVCIVAEKGD